MKVEKINRLSTNEKKSPAIHEERAKQAMFGCNFDKDEGIKVETDTENIEKNRIYEKKETDENGNITVYKYNTKDNSLLSKTTKDISGYEKTEIYKKGTKLIEKRQEFFNNVLINEEEFYDSAPFSLKSKKNFENGLLKTEEIYDNGENSPHTIREFSKGRTTETKYIDGNFESRNVYRKNGKPAELTKRTTTNEGEKGFANYVFRPDGSLYQESIYPPYDIENPILSVKYSSNGKTPEIISRKEADGRFSVEEFQKNSKPYVKTFYDDNAGKIMRERIVYDRSGEEYLHTFYDENGKITAYTKNRGDEEDFNEKSLNGRLDTWFKQGKSGVCYIASPVKSLLLTESGQKILEDSLDYDETTKIGKVYLKGASKEYSFTKDEIKDAMGRLGSGDPDFTLLVMGYEKYREEFQHKPVDGGKSDEFLKVLTGKECLTNYHFGIAEPLTDKSLKSLEKMLETKNYAITAGTPEESGENEFSKKEKKQGLKPEHSFALTKIDEKFVYLVDPVSNKKIKLSKEEFKNDFQTFTALKLQ